MKCRTKAVPIRGPKCKTCGKPVASLETEYCPDCQEKTHFFTSGRAVFLYEKEIRKSVYQFKFHNKREYAGFYVSEMERVCGDEIRTWNPDVIIPIPMYKRKKRQRGYNQAEILAKCLGKRLQNPVDTKSLVRVRKTIPQKSLGRKEREINLFLPIAFFTYLRYLLVAQNKLRLGESSISSNSIMLSNKCSNNFL